jgi:hypothetical protein
MGSYSRVNQINLHPSTRYGDGILSNGTKFQTGRFLGRNRAFNCDFDLMQRAGGANPSITINNTSTGTKNAYTFDRWQCVVGAMTSATVSQASDTLAGTYVAQVGRSNGTSGTSQIKFGQTLTINMCKHMAGNPCSYQVKLAAGSGFSGAGGLLTVRVYSGTGTTDVSNLSTGFVGATPILDTTIALNATLTINMFELGTLLNNVTQLSLEFSYIPTGSNAANDYFVVSRPQIEDSLFCTPFEYRAWQEHLDTCCFFYQKSYDYQVAPGTLNTYAGAVPLANNTSILGAIGNYSFVGAVFMVEEMRTTPSIATYSIVGGKTSTLTTMGGADMNSGTGAPAVQNSKCFSIQNISGGSINSSYGGFFVHYLADAEIY